jgi:hypothetical protein
VCVQRRPVWLRLRSTAQLPPHTHCCVPCLRVCSGPCRGPLFIAISCLDFNHTQTWEGFAGHQVQAHPASKRLSAMMGPGKKVATRERKKVVLPQTDRVHHRSHEQPRRQQTASRQGGSSNSLRLSKIPEWTAGSGFRGARARWIRFTSH